jgi:hypothetical protein
MDFYYSSLAIQHFEPCNSDYSSNQSFQKSFSFVSGKLFSFYGTEQFIPVPKCSFYGTEHFGTGINLSI